jgi:excisionase family DNA binding protein
LEEGMARELADVLTAEEAADYLRVSLKTLYRLVAAGQVPGQKVGRSWRFRKADLVAFLQGRS